MYISNKQKYLKFCKIKEFLDFRLKNFDLMKFTLTITLESREATK